MDQSKNRIPDRIKTIHLVAACGTAMGALACLLKKQGYRVTGSDSGIYPPMSTHLQESGVTLYEGFKAENLNGNPDLVVIGNAVTKINPEAVETDKRSLFYCSMPQAINHFLARDKKPIVVTGTHGKTTTASLLAWVLYHAGLDPSFLIGGIHQNFNSNFRMGNGNYFVIEGDEYDTAFFDKDSKFFHYNPHISILTSVEFDHADIFRDFDHVKDTFKRYVRIHNNGMHIVACVDDPVVSELITEADGQVYTYGKENGDLRFSNLKVEGSRTIGFDVQKKADIYDHFSSVLPGDHNTLNTLAVIGVADLLGISSTQIKSALETFKSVRRRQEVVGVKNDITVIDDFAHHPTAVAETIKAIKPFSKNGRLIVVFEPRTNTSMRKVFQEAYAQAFTGADLICIRQPSKLDKIPEEQRFSSEDLVLDLQTKGAKSYYFSDTEPIIEFLVENTTTGDTVLIMSNGGFDNIHRRLLNAL